MVIKILGKLGGKNRAFLKDSAACSPEPYFKPVLSIGLPLGLCTNTSTISSDGSGDGGGGELRGVPVDGSDGILVAAEPSSKSAFCYEAVLQLGLDRVVCLVLQLLQHADADRAAASLCYASEPLLTSVGSRIAAHPQHACGTSDLESDASGSEQSSSKGSEKKGRDIAHAASSEMQTKETAEKGLQLLQGLFAADGAASPGLCLSLCESCIAADMRYTAGRLLQQVLLLLINFDSPLSLYWLLLTTRAAAAQQSQQSQHSRQHPSSKRQLPDFCSDRVIPAGAAAQQQQLLEQEAQLLKQQQLQRDKFAAAAVTYPLDKRRAALRTKSHRDAEQLLLQQLLQALLLLACDDAVYESRQLQLAVLDKKDPPQQQPHQQTQPQGDPQTSTSSSCASFVYGLLQHCALIFAARVTPEDSASLCTGAALHELDAACVIRALTACLRLDASALLPTLHAIRALERCCTTFVMVRHADLNRMHIHIRIHILMYINAYKFFALAILATSSASRRESSEPRLTTTAFALLSLQETFYSDDMGCFEMCAEGTDARLSASLAEELLLLLVTHACLGYRGKLRLPWLLQLFALQQQEEEKLHSPFLSGVLAAAEAEAAFGAAADAAVETAKNPAAAAAAAATAAPSGAAWKLPPPIPESFPVQQQQRRQPYKGGPWWLKQSDLQRVCATAAAAPPAADWQQSLGAS
ncbi:uncharacterized protein LOC113146913 [Cyclospora cayetanensis]|uniref:Uncharacterized protein LOC113146913 n=1 Tax=Cyclospora cayetanensis TaxID=88456 RepID=A0A6P6RUE1_9EIME|nr:uncharacterized protein LOC113146913 [Cyclospora cayetanensis]